MHRRPERYNAKARHSVAGSSHKKSKTRTKKHDGAPEQQPVDPNAEVLELKSLEAKELDRRAKMRQEVRR